MDLFEYFNDSKIAAGPEKHQGAQLSALTRHSCVRLGVHLTQRSTVSLSTGCQMSGETKRGVE